ncbi:MAG TPA: NAD(P)-binding domain-containing protein [Streptosporangiaceae bacterium]|jgi:hypothetical protein
MDRQVGILGAGTIGAEVGRFFAAAGWRVVISGAHGPGALAGVAAGLGPGAAPVTAGEAIRSEVVLLATPWTAVEAVLRDAPSWHGRVLIDATNAIKVYAPPRVELYDFGTQTSSEVVAGLAPGARVVKAFNHLPFFQLTAPVHDGERRASFLCGDDAGAKADVAAVLEHAGLAPIDLGGLRAGGLLASIDLRLAGS